MTDYSTVVSVIPFVCSTVHVTMDHWIFCFARAGDREFPEQPQSFCNRSSLSSICSGTLRDSPPVKSLCMMYLLFPTDRLNVGSSLDTQVLVIVDRCLV